MIVSQAHLTSHVFLDRFNDDAMIAPTPAALSTDPAQHSEAPAFWAPKATLTLGIGSLSAFTGSPAMEEPAVHLPTSKPPSSRWGTPVIHRICSFMTALRNYSNVQTLTVQEKKLLSDIKAILPHDTSSAFPSAVPKA